MTMGQVQMPRGPPLVRTNANVVKIPVVIEMNENATANDSKWRRERTNCCRYPYLSSWASSSWVARVATVITSSDASAGEAFLRPGGLVSAGFGQGPSLRAAGPQDRDARGGERLVGAGLPLVVGEDRGDAVERADPVHGDDAELAGVGQHVGGGGVVDDRAADHHLGRVVVGEPGLGVDPAGAEERPVGVELGEECLGVRAGAGAVAVPHLPAAQK